LVVHTRIYQPVVRESLSVMLYGMHHFTASKKKILYTTHGVTVVQSWVSGPAVNRPRNEAGHLHSSSAEVENAWSYTSIPQ